MPDRRPERFYAREIAPALQALARRCTEGGLSLVALVAYDDAGSIARTLGLRFDAPPMLRAAEVLASCWAEGGDVNVDAFLFALMRDARERGHSSELLLQLGVPFSSRTQPAAPRGAAHG